MSLSLFAILAFIIISIIGTLLHFTHGWFKRGVLVHLLSAVNESTWEHMKLIFVPAMLLLFPAIYLYYDQFPNFWASYSLMLLAMLILIPAQYYTMKLFWDRVPFQLTIALFYISIFVGVYLWHYLLDNQVYLFPELLGAIIVGLLTVAFALFTYFPPHMFLFLDPVTGSYGDKEHVT